jgi:hypothetical protein
MRFEMLVCINSKLLNVLKRESLGMVMTKVMKEMSKEFMFGVLLGKEHVLEIESLVLRSIKDLEAELLNKNLNEKVKKQLIQKKEILKEVYLRLPL